MAEELTKIKDPSKEGWQGFRWYEFVLYGFVTSGFLILGAIVALSGVIAFGLQSLIRPLRSRRRATVFFGIWACVSLAWVWWAYRSPINLEGETIAITVSPNDSFASFATQLDQKGVLSSPMFFKLMAKVRGVDRRLWVGRYEFSGTVTLASILEDIETGRVATVSVTIPEGSTVGETARLVARHLKIDADIFATICYDTVRCQSKYAIPNAEGYLFPETYRFNIGVRAEEVVDRMVYTAVATINELGLATPERTLGMSEVVALASIIEAESRDGSEREIISSVYHNRLKKKMRLQADPTVAYSLGGVRRSLLYRDLRIDHPYNTYRNYGLPPGPINSPGRASMEAALRPANTDYLFFVADGSGGHIFTSNNADHNRARATVRDSRLRDGDDSTVVGGDQSDSTTVAPAQGAVFTGVKAAG